MYSNTVRVADVCSLTFLRQTRARWASGRSTIRSSASKNSSLERERTCRSRSTRTWKRVGALQLHRTRRRELPVWWLHWVFTVCSVTFQARVFARLPREVWGALPAGRVRRLDRRRHVQGGRRAPEAPGARATRSRLPRNRRFGAEKDTVSDFWCHLLVPFICVAIFLRRLVCTVHAILVSCRLCVSTVHAVDFRDRYSPIHSSQPFQFTRPRLFSMMSNALLYCVVFASDACYKLQ